MCLWKRLWVPRPFVCGRTLTWWEEGERPQVLFQRGDVAGGAVVCVHPQRPVFVVVKCT